MESNRRTFLKSGLTTLAAAPLAGASALSPNDRPTYGLIGAGGRGRYLNKYFLKTAAKCVAVCDVYEPSLTLAKADATDAKVFVDYHELLAQPGIDFVVLAGPDHHHCPMLLDALKAGKDAYAEKPLARTLEEGAKMVAAVRKSDRIVQIGMQRRSAPAVLRAKQAIDDGMLGRVTMVKAQWNWNIARPLDNSPLPGKLDWQKFLGTAPDRPLTPMRWRYWRWFKDYAGGNMTDQGTHLMDVVQWFLGAGAPASAICQGFIAKNSGAEHPEVFSAVFDYGSVLATWSLNYCNDYDDNWSILFQGDQGTMHLDDAGYKVWKEPWRTNHEPLIQQDAPVPIETHIANFLDCIKSRQQPNCPVEIAQRAVAGPHIANIAMQTGRKITLGADLVSYS
jgi:predicted dehydrogenase